MEIEGIAAVIGALVLVAGYVVAVVSAGQFLEDFGRRDKNLRTVPVVSRGRRRDQR